VKRRKFADLGKASEFECVVGEDRKRNAHENLIEDHLQNHAPQLLLVQRLVRVGLDFVFSNDFGLVRNVQNGVDGPENPVYAKRVNCRPPNKQRKLVFA
jgi:hypothetical protein